MSFLIWARRDSNPRPKDYESSALPLRHRPVAIVILLSCFRRCVSGKTPFPALPTSPRKIINLPRRQSAVVTLMEKIKQKQESLIEAINECDVQLYELLQENGVL